MIYYTGDTHGAFSRIIDFINEQELTSDDTIVILGDAGFNFHGQKIDRPKKQIVNKYKVNIFCIHGNHEMRPSTIPGYKIKEFCGGKVYYEEAFPYIMFAIDGEVYDLDGRKSLVIGGAYSVDKEYRRAMGWPWWPDEQPSEEIKKTVETKLESLGWEVDQILTHTCPVAFEPVDKFLPGIDQSTVDKSTEQWLGYIEYKTKYNRWLCGHFHINRTVFKLRFLMEDIIT